MGIKTLLTLDEANRLFEEYDFLQIKPTTDGIIDTTYIVENSTAGYILKKFEEADANRIEEERRLLKKFAACQLDVPRHLCSAGDWHLYSRLHGRTLNTVTYLHLRTLGHTLSLMHRCACAEKSRRKLFEKESIAKQLKELRAKRYGAYATLRHLQHYHTVEEGVIHGDLFRDNVLFSGRNIGIIDFIDAGEGSFAFDLGVTALAWALRSHSLGSLRLFLKSYNQYAPKKVSLKALLKEIEAAAAFYTLKRMAKSGSPLAHKSALMKKTAWLKRGRKW